MADEPDVPASEITEIAEGTAPVPKGLGARALTGIAWNYMAVAVQAVGQVTYTVIMARLVSPEAFGLVAMTMVARGLGGLLARMGIGQALIQKPSLSAQEKRAGFTLSVLLGIGLFGLFWVLAPALGGLFDEVRAVPVIRGASLGFVALGLSSTAESLMQRELRFKEGALIHIVGFLIGYFVIGVGAALAGAGVWALVFAPISHKLITGILMYPRIRHPVRPTLDPNSYRVLLSFGSRLSLVQLGELFGNHADTVVVGRYAGAELLGMYNRAFYLVVLPLQMIMSTMSRVLFASFSRIQSDLPRLKRAYLASGKVSAALFFPVAAGIGAAGHELIVVLLGEIYREAASVVPFLAVYASMNKVSLLCGMLCEACAELNKRLALQAAYLVGLVGALLAVAGGPLWAYAAVLAGGEVARNLAYNIFIIRKIIPAGLSELTKIYAPGISAAALVIAAVIATRALTIDVMGVPLIIALVAEGTAAAVTVLLLMRRGPLSFLRHEILSRMPLDQPDSGRGRLVAVAVRLVFGRSPQARV